MTKMNQKEAVFSAVTNVVGKFEGACTPTKDQRASINAILFEGFRSGKIELEREFTDSELKGYVSGLQSNWLRKDKRLNGGVQYVAKNPGSRAGSTDPQIKALRVLMSSQTEPTKIAHLKSLIDKRIAEIKPSKSVTLSAEQVAMLAANGIDVSEFTSAE